MKKLFLLVLLCLNVNGASMKISAYPEATVIGPLDLFITAYWSGTNYSTNNSVPYSLILNQLSASISSNLVITNFSISNFFATNLFVSNIYATNIYSSNIYTTNIYTSNLYSTIIYTSNLFSTNIYTSNLYATNIYVYNLNATNLYTSNLYATNIFSENIYTSNLFATNVYTTNLYASNIYATNISVYTLNVNDLVVTNSLIVNGINALYRNYGAAASDLTTALTTGTNKAIIRLPHAMTLTSVRASLLVEQTGGSIFTVDVNENGTSVLSTKITIDNGENSSVDAATQPVISDSALAADSEIEFDIDQIGDGTAIGLQVWIIGIQVP